MKLALQSGFGDAAIVSSRITYWPPECDPAASYNAGVPDPYHGYCIDWQGNRITAGPGTGDSAASPQATAGPAAASAGGGGAAVLSFPYGTATAAASGSGDLTKWLLIAGAALAALVLVTRR